jgi:putative tricarboxylic transport membrane protein
MEEYLSRGSWSVFVTSPLSGGLLLAAVALLVVVALPSIRKKRDATFQEEV